MAGATHTPAEELMGRYYWPSDEYSVPADNLCWHVPPAPNRDFRCIRPAGHPGKHEYEWSPTIKGHSHRHAKAEGGAA